MAAINIPDLTSPISDNDPCGPDLELAGDIEFMGFMARTEGLLPVSYFSGPEGKPFDRSLIDLSAEFANARPFLTATRDVRLLVLLSKFCILSRNLEGFVTCVNAIAFLLKERWQEVHPRGDNGGFGIRIAVLETLDDSAPVIFPLQYMPLFENRRLGPISYRHFMFAKGEAQPREGEQSHDLASLEKAALEGELATLLDVRSEFESLHGALDSVRKVCVDQLGASGAPNLQKLTDLAGKIFTLLNELAIKLDPNAGVAQPNVSESKAASVAAPMALPGQITSRTEAASALEAAACYFMRFEPSNPALLLIRQAQQLIGKSLFEVLQILMPAKVEEAKVRFGREQALQIPIERLSQFGSSPNSAEPAENTETVDASATNGGSQSGANGPAQSRQEALAMLEQISAYYRIAEPSSPIALIAERARGLADRDFMGLLKELLAPPE
jgi:type VI secretion system protein ImpA